jgi:hypothetical protein
VVSLQTDKESIFNSAPVFPGAAWLGCRQPFAAYRKAKRHQHQTKPRHARKLDRSVQVVKYQSGGISFWFHGYGLTQFGWLVLIDKT